MFKRVTALGSGAPWAAGAASVAVGSYAAIVAAAWARYGHPSPPAPAERDLWLEQFMPEHEVAERHHVQVHAPAELVLDAAKAVRVRSSPLARALIRARAILLGVRPAERGPGHGLLQETLSLGWGVLADVPGHEVVMGAVTQPWLGQVVFRAVPPGQFREFAEPGFVKIAWTLRADAVGPNETILRTETRVASTDFSARQRFRWYWARFSPGIVLIRLALLRAIARDAERRARAR